MNSGEGSVYMFLQDRNDFFGVSFYYILLKNKLQIFPSSPMHVIK